MTKNQIPVPIQMRKVKLMKFEQKLLEYNNSLKYNKRFLSMCYRLLLFIMSVLKSHPNIPRKKLEVFFSFLTTIRFSLHCKNRHKKNCVWVNVPIIIKLTAPYTKTSLCYIYIYICRIHLGIHYEENNQKNTNEKNAVTKAKARRKEN